MSSPSIVALLAGGSLALVSAAHCALMCGPVALSARLAGGAYARASYLGGRLVSYTIMGALAGSVGSALLLSPWARWAEAGMSWLLALTLLLAARSALRSGREGAGLVALRAGPRRSLVGRMLARVADDPLLLGAATALLPCGALYSALTAAAALGSAAQGALAMAAFSAVTGAAVVGVAQLGSLRTRGPVAGRLIGGALLLGAAVMLLRPVPMLRAGSEVPACHAAHAEASR